MSDVKHSIIQPVSSTICALLALVVSFIAAYGHPPFSVFSVMLFFNILIIAIAIFSWIYYLKIYIKYEIEHSLIKKENS